MLMVGCSSAPIVPKFPEVPAELMAECSDLKELESTTKLSDVVKSVADNYGRYHECRIKIEVWTEWYKSQKKIFEGVR
jgi:hypothetical protein